jgi:hypothetical protein
MGTTFGELKTRVSLVLQDPAQRTFTESLVEELIFAGLTEVGMLAPEQFTEDLDPVAGQLTYALRDSEFSSVAVPEIELVRVEVWDTTQSPEVLVAAIPEAGLEWATSDSGWSVWNGALTIPSRIANNLIGYESDYVIRVWGYSPYVFPTDDSSVLSVSKDVEGAILAYAQLEALRQLLSSRNLFTQWQTRSGATDISPAGLMNEKNIAEQNWRQKSRAITRLRARV